VEHAPLFISLLSTRSNTYAASCKLVAVPQLVVGPTNKNVFFLLYQTIIVVAAGEPHPQPQYQTASRRVIE